MCSQTRCHPPKGSQGAVGNPTLGKGNGAGLPEESNLPVLLSTRPAQEPWLPIVCIMRFPSADIDLPTFECGTII